MATYDRLKFTDPVFQIRKAGSVCNVENENGGGSISVINSDLNDCIRRARGGGGENRKVS